METINNYDAVYDIWLSLRQSIGNVRAKLLVDYFGSAQAIYESSYEELKAISGITGKMAEELCDKDLTKAISIKESCEKTGCRALGISGSDYPSRLRDIFDPPSVVYFRGDMPPVDEIAVVGMVGTRRCTPYGYKNAEKTAYELSKHGIAVSTGLAIGIDTAAASGALGGSMPVIGVIACGADIVYPARNARLFEKIMQNGAIISEHPPGTEAMPCYFPSRNRIISGLSVGVAVIEAPARSGALITAQRALEQNRDIFVLPGNVDSPACAGSNKLLRDGAIPYISADDIITEYADLFDGIEKPIDNEAAVDYIDLEKLMSNFGTTEKIIINAVSRVPLHIDEIIANTGIDAQTTLASLTVLELGGIARRQTNGKWEIFI